MKKDKTSRTKIERIRNYYDALILKTKTIRDCEDILRELDKDQEIPSTEYWDVYWSLEARARRIKQNQKAILAEAEAAIRTQEKMLASRE